MLVKLAILLLLIAVVFAQLDELEGTVPECSTVTR